ncbi:MAG: STAS domain-containing protein [Victivallales bacterium]|nr:STAS domain-containing protein [Victivallales bacterium]
MDINVSEKDGVVVVSLAGRLDAVSSSSVTEKLDAIAANGIRVLFDLKPLEYISSAGLRALLVIAKKIRTCNGKMCLTGLNDNVREEVDVSGFSSILDVCESEEEALGLLNE